MSRQIQFALNVGSEDAARFSIPAGADGGPPREGEVLTVDDDEAERLCRLVACCTKVRAELPGAAASIAEETPRQAMLRKKKDGEQKESSL